MTIQITFSLYPEYIITMGRGLPCKKIWIKPPKCGLSGLYLTPKRYHFTTDIFFFTFNPKKMPWQLTIVAFCPVHPKWDKNPLFVQPRMRWQASLTFLHGSPPLTHLARYNQGLTDCYQPQTWLIIIIIIHWTL